MEREHLETARLSLYPWSESDAALLARLSANPEVVRFIGSGVPWTPTMATEVAAAQAEHWREHGFGWRRAVEATTGQPVGFMALNFTGDGAVGLDAWEYEVGWWLEPAAWGRGLAREGASAMRDEAFGSLHAASVVARIQPENEASVSVAAAVGLRFEFATTGRAGERVDVYRLAAAAEGE